MTKGRNANLAYHLKISTQLHVYNMKATSQLSHALKLEAATVSDSASQTKLLTAAKMLADATAQMVEAAKVRRTE